MSQNVMSITATPDAGRAWRLCQFPALLLSPDDRIIWYIALRRDKEKRFRHGARRALIMGLG
jgi:hypothetical protein